MKIKKSVKKRIIAERKEFLREVTKRVRRKTAKRIRSHATPMSESLLLHVRMTKKRNRPISVLVSIYRPKTDYNRPHPDSEMFSGRTRDLYQAQSFWIDANRDPSKLCGVRYSRVKQIAESRSYWEDLWISEVKFNLGDLAGPKKLYRMFHTLK